MQKLSEESLSNKTPTFLDAHIELPDKRPQCFLKDIYRKESPSNMQLPIIMSIKKSVAASSLLNSTPSITCPKALKRTSTQLSTSINLSDTEHQRSMKPKKIEFQPTCSESIVLGVTRPFIGNCAGNATRQHSGKKVFSLTEDPRKKFCLKNPKALHYKPIPSRVEQANIIELVKNAGNVSTSSDSLSNTSSICEVIDLANPLNLDFQGMDYKNTYARDEQTCQNQMEYRRVRRFKHRRNVKAETIINTEKEQQEERTSIPKHFAINKPHLGKVPEADKNKFLGKLIRSEQKPKVIQRLDEEEENRRERYKQLYLHKKEKLAQLAAEENANQKATDENRAMVLAEKDIQDLVGILDRTVTTKKMELRQIPKRRDFPHTLAEALKFRHQLKKSKRILRDRARVKQEFYAEIGKPKRYPEAELDISSDSLSFSCLDEDKTSDDEDDMIVGQQGGKFLLRGFHYKMGSNLRGKFHQNYLATGEQKLRGCMTRDEWLDTLLPNKRKVETLFEKPAPGMELFPRELGVKQPQAKSAIREFRRKPLGRHYDRVHRRNLRIKKPKQIKVKKFNMIGFLYGIGGKKKSEPIQKDIQLGQTLEYIHNRAKIDRDEKRIQNRRRMHYLPLPCPPKRANSPSLDSDSDDSDWIPEDIGPQQLPKEHLNLRARGNMPAPEYRETTLCRNPNHPRDYKRLRVPSELFDDFVRNTNIPVMKKLENDAIYAENVDAVESTEHARKFEVRHHHDHWNPTQHKTVHVLYSRKIVKPEVMKEKSVE